MKKPFFHLSIPGASGVSGEPNSEANFDATNAVTDASCEPNCEATVVRPGSAPQEGNALSTLGGNPEPPEAFYSQCIAFEINRMLAACQHYGAPDDVLDSLFHSCKAVAIWSLSLQQQR